MSPKVNNFLTIAGLSLVLFSSTVFAATIRVPSEQPTIQAGIYASVNGDTVLVADGTYTGAGNKNINYASRAIIVISENGPDHTIVDCQNNGRGFIFCFGEDSFSRLEGFTIRNGSENASGGGIYCYESSPTITNCTITGNTADYGGGIYCRYSSPTITNCTINGNTADDYRGGGIYCWYSSPTITNCTITGNTADYGGGIYCRNSSPTITNCAITGSTAGWKGGGIYCRNSSPTITNCTIYGNTSGDDGGGIHCTYESSPTITNCTITRNTADSSGGGIYCYDDSSPTITNCTITGNSAGWDGGGIYSDWSSPIITNCTISGNTAGWDGGGIYSDWSSPIITNCTISGNSASGTYSDGGGIYCNYSSPTITNCILWNDSPDEVSVYDGDPVITYSDVQGGWVGAGNIDIDPAFVKEDWGDYRLLWGSPCIDAGHPDSSDGDGTRGDMGAHFFDQSKKLLVYLSPETDEIAPGGTGLVCCTVCNSRPYGISFGAAAAILLPDGAPWPGNPLEEPLFTSIAPSGNLAREFEYRAPFGWSPGTYSFAAGAGYNGRIYDLDHFEFTVLENSAGVE